MIEKKECSTSASCFRCSFIVGSGSIDRSGTLRRSELFRIFQKAASADLERTNLSVGRMSLLKLAWVITEQYVEIRRMPCAGEKVTVETWPGKTKHVFFPRYYRLLEENGRELAKGCSEWVLMDEEKRSLAFPSIYGIHADAVITGNEIPMPRSVRRPVLEKTLTFTVPPDMIDSNGHMNNAAYFDLADEVIPRADDLAPKSMHIQYFKELRQGDVIEVGCSSSDGVCFMEGCSEDQIYFRMRMTWE